MKDSTDTTEPQEAAVVNIQRGQALTPEQRIGAACVRCGVDFRAAAVYRVPAGIVGGVQLSRCGQHCGPGPKRPSWLPDGCPSWCGWGEDHEENAHYDDRMHSGSRVGVVLTAVRDRELRDPKDVDPSALYAHLAQHYREIEPRIELERDERVLGVQLTLDEGDQFARGLLTLSGKARTAGAPQVTETCPAWCREHFSDISHIGTDFKVGPMLAGLFATPGEAPVISLITDDRRKDSDRALTVGEAEELGLALLELAAAAREGRS